MYTYDSPTFIQHLILSIFLFFYHISNISYLIYCIRVSLSICFSLKELKSFECSQIFFLCNIVNIVRGIITLNKGFYASWNKFCRK